MSLRCKDPNKCPNGNCIGCTNGKLHCNDTNCYPSCTGCAGNVPLVGSRLNADGDIPPSDKGKTPMTSDDVTFFGENIVLTAFIIIITFVIVGFIFYFFYIILDEKSSTKYDTSEHILSQTL